LSKGLTQADLRSLSLSKGLPQADLRSLSLSKGLRPANPQGLRQAQAAEGAFDKLRQRKGAFDKLRQRKGAFDKLRQRCIGTLGQRPTGIKEFHAELTARRYRYYRPGLSIESDAWEFSVEDGFGNALRFCERI
jgi:erythromycin esterase-like protein